jgi:hypothetical protein
MPQGPNTLATSVLFIDESQDQRTHWAEQIKSCSEDYETRFIGLNGFAGRPSFHSNGCALRELRQYHVF